MGKDRRKRRRAKKPQPTGLPSMQETTAEEAELGNPSSTSTTGNSTFQGQSIAVLEKLQSGSDEERECACTTLATLVQDASAMETLLDHNIVKSLAPLLMDKRPSIREAAAGALRNLSASSNQDVCMRMVDDDVFTPLATLLQQFSSAIPQPSQEMSGDAVKKDPALNTLLQALHLLWNLCENASTAVSLFNQYHLMKLLLDTLQMFGVCLELSLTAAHCLQTVTEDNVELAKELCKPHLLPILEGALMCPGERMQHLLLRNLIAGCMYNIKESLPAAGQGQTMQVIAKIISQTLEIDAANRMATLLPQIQTNGTTLSKVVSEELREMESLVSAQQVALEVTSNMCCPEDDEEWEDLDSSSSSSDDLDDGSEVMQEDSLMMPLCLSAEIQSSLTNQQLPNKVLLKIGLPEKDFMQNLEACKETKTVFKGLLRVQSRALMCLQNLIAAVELESLGGPEALTLVLQKLLDLIQLVPSEDESVEALTSALRSTLHKMAENKFTPEILTDSHLSAIASLCQSSSNDAIRVNFVGTLGSVGSLLAFNEETQQLLMAVGTQLLEVATKDNSLWVTAEALDAIFDVFGDGDIADIVAANIGLVAKLRTLVPQLKARFRQGKSALGEHLPVVISARSNLARFIKYKEAQQCK
ncbi:HEAT repeat-containing protein 3-like [Amphiura filiformis]|uniref:HEAT repeat-containing protein 3-like n=1 Tax=Amphiura filiformis TaxID=82378 RepID=UPI003B2119A7